MKQYIFGLVTLISVTSFAAGEAPSSFTYQGKVYKSNGIDPLEAPAVTYKLQIRSPDGLCLLFEETHLRDMSGTNGIFSLIVGEGSNTNASNLTLIQVFDNSAAKVGAAGCTYTPISGDTRRLRFSYDDGVQVVNLPTDQNIRSVPYALNALSLQGATKNDFIRVSANITQSKVETLLSYFTELVALATGTSSSYVKTSDLPVAGGVLNLSSSGVKVADAPAAGDYAVNRNYSDSKLGGRTLDFTGLGDGQTMTWNSAQNKWQAANLSAGTMTSVTAGAGLSGGIITGTGTISLPAVGTPGTYSKITTDAFGRVTAGVALSNADLVASLGYTPLNKSGDTLSGPMDMNSHNLTNTGYITMASGKYLGLGSYNAATETTLVTSVLTPGGANYAGVTWYNSTAKAVNYWDGSQVISMATSANGVYSIPMSSTAGVAAGLLSNTDYANFSSKQSSLGYSPLDRAGTNSMTGNLNMSPDGGTTLFKITNLKNPTANQDAATKLYCDSNVGGYKSSVSVLNDTTDVGKMLTWSGSGLGWMAIAPSSGTVTSVIAGAGLSGGTINSSGTISMPNVGTAGTYAKVTTDAQGRVTSGTTLSGSDIPAPAGDLNGSFLAMVVQKIQGIAVSNVAPVAGQVMTYNGATTRWEAQTPAASSVSSVAGRTGAVTLTHADVSGTTTVAQGGTGQTSYTSGQVLVGNASGGLTKATLTAGTGVTVSNGDGAITVNADVGTTAGKVVQLDGSGRLPAVDASQLTNLPMIPFSNVVVLDSSSSWSTNGAKKVYVQVWGGGGGGGGGTSAALAGGGGGGGGYTAGFVDVSAVSSVAVTVGAGGSAGASTQSGSAGGASSFGATMSVTGGAGGSALAQGSSAGGTILFGIINVVGGRGSPGTEAGGVLSLSLIGAGGVGGSAGGGGGNGAGGSSASNVNGGVGSSPGGAGGGGGCSLLGAASGGNGGAGRVIVWY